MDDINIKDLKDILENLKKQDEIVKKKRRKMKTGKKALWLGMLASVVLVVFSMAMIVLDKDTQTTSILGGAGVAAIPVLFGIYEKYSTQINLKHMEENYIVDYDEKEGIY